MQKFSTESNKDNGKAFNFKAKIAIVVLIIIVALIVIFNCITYNMFFTTNFSSWCFFSIIFSIFINVAIFEFKTVKLFVAIST